jgi:hypothetical protein
MGLLRPIPYSIFYTLLPCNTPQKSHLNTTETAHRKESNMRHIFLSAFFAFILSLGLGGSAFAQNIVQNSLTARQHCNADHQKDPKLCLLVNTDWGLLAPVNDNYMAIRIIGTTLFRGGERELWQVWKQALGVRQDPKPGMLIGPDNSGALLEGALVWHLNTCAPGDCFTEAIRNALIQTLPALKRLDPDNAQLWSALENASILPQSF